MSDRANHFTFSGAGVEGLVDTTSITGRPIGSIRVDEHESTEVELVDSPEGIAARFQLAAVPDGPSTTALVLLPETNLSDGPVEFGGLVVITVTRGSIGGPDLVRGAIQSYDARQVSGTAAAVRS